MDFISLLWAAFLAFGPVLLTHWLNGRRQKKKSGTRRTGNRTSEK